MISAWMKYKRTAFVTAPRKLEAGDSGAGVARELGGLWLKDML